MSANTRVSILIPFLLLQLFDPALAQPSGIDIEAVGLLPGGDTQERLLLRVEEEPTGRLAPLLPYLFFEDGSATLPDRYRGGDGGVTSDRFVRVQRDILRVLADRMRRWPEDRLVVTGTTSGADADRRTRRVAMRRAESVASYLAEQLGVPRERITVRARGLPEQPSNGRHPQGRAENRRVEFSGSERLLAPVSMADSVTVASSPGMKLLPSIPNEISDSARWRIELTHAGKLFRRLSGRARMPEAFTEVFSDDELRWFASEGAGAIEVRMVVQVGSDSVVIGPRMIRFDVRRERAGMRSPTSRPQDRESIVLFGFDSDVPMGGSAAVLEDLLARIPPEARINVAGFTDETGDHEHNVELSRRRADAVARMLGPRAATVQGAGESGGLHWNQHAEDRFYSRVVRLTLQ